MSEPKPHADKLPQTTDPVTIFKAFDDKMRLQIIQELRNGEKCFSHLKETLGLPQPRLSYHLKILLLAGLISLRQDGKNKYYSINSAGRDQALKTLIDLTGPKFD